jgi:hypothetical protein
MVNPCGSCYASKLVAVPLRPPGGSGWSGLQKGSHIFDQKVLVGSSKDSEEVAAKRAVLLERLAGSYMVAASAGKTEWATFVRLFSLNEISLSADLTRTAIVGAPLAALFRPWAVRLWIVVV